MPMVLIRFPNPVLIMLHFWDISPGPVFLQELGNGRDDCPGDKRFAELALEGIHLLSRGAGEI